MHKHRNWLIPSPECFERLLKRAQADARGNLGVFFNSFREYLLHIGQGNMPRELWGKASPSDFVQEAFLDVQKAFARFHGHTVKEACGWLRRIYLRKVARYYRRFVDVGKRQVVKEISINSRRGQAEIRHVAESSTDSPLDQAIEHEQAQRLQLAYTRLSADHRQVIHLHYFKKMNFKDIGGELGCSPDAARMLCNRAKRQLARLGDQKDPNVK